MPSKSSKPKQESVLAPVSEEAEALVKSMDAALKKLGNAKADEKVREARGYIAQAMSAMKEAKEWDAQ